MTGFRSNRSIALLRAAAAATSLAVALTLALMITRTSGAAQSSAKPMRVLFIGNSYTYVNNLPGVLIDMAAASHQSVFEPTVVLVGGSTLEAHLTRGDAMREIEKGGWDFVVVQEQSTRPMDAPASFFRDVPTFAAAVKKTGARMVLYESWARETSPQLQDSLSRMYHQAAKESNALLAHVGEAWAAYRVTEQVTAPEHSALFIADGSHPSQAGTYVAACVFYATLYGKSPVGLPPVARNGRQQPPVGPTLDSPHDSISAPLAAKLQRLAWSAAKP